MGLSNYQLVLLDNLIYLDTIIEDDMKGKTIGYVVNKLLYADGNPDNGAGTGTLQTDCYNAHNGGANSMMTLDEWKAVLQAIEKDPCLRDLQIHNVEDAGKNGFRAATFISNETGENVIIFRGTSTANEWRTHKVRNSVFGNRPLYKRNNSTQGTLPLLVARSGA